MECSGSGEAAVRCPSCFPWVYLDPTEVEVQVGERFTVDVRIAGAESMVAWEFKLRWDSAVIRPVGVSEGLFLSGGGSTYFVKNIGFDCMRVGCVLFGPSSVSESGVLASITFETVGAGWGDLDLHDAKLLDNALGMIDTSEHDGQVRVG